MKEYKCSLDNMARYVVPGLVFIIFMLTLATPVYLSMTMPENTRVPIAYITPALLLGISIAMYFLRPLSVKIYDFSITINRKIKPVIIEFSEVRAISKVHDMKFAMRTFGNGGLFGYTGKYYQKDIGSMTWYCTQRKNYILIEKTNGKNIVITPDDPDGLLQEIAIHHSFLVID